MTARTGNEPFFEWPEPDSPAREVWYSLVTHPERPIAVWYRYTLVSTPDDAEARLWAALSDGERGEYTFTSQRVALNAVELTDDPFSLALPAGRLADDQAVGNIEGHPAEAPTDERQSPPTRWELSYEPDSYTFTPLEDETRMLEIAEQFGSGVHWGANQSVRMDGEVAVGDREITFESAPGHQGHTAGASAPDEWTWVHCNDFADADVSVEVLSMDTLTPALLRRDDEIHALNGDLEVFNAVETSHNEPGLWELAAEEASPAWSARVVAAPDHWQLVSYLTPDSSLRYNAHCSLADITLEIDGETLHSSRARVEWVRTEPPVPGSYPPFDPYVDAA